MERPFCFNQSVPVPFAVAAELLADHPHVVLGAASESLTLLPDGKPREMHVIAPTPNAPHDVDVVIGPLHHVDSRAVMIPIEWVSVSGARWFPAVDAEIELIDESHRIPWTQVSFFGHYEPRGGVMGGIADAVTHDAVEQTLRQYLVEVCRHLELAIGTERSAVGADTDSTVGTSSV